MITYTYKAEQSELEEIVTRPEFAGKHIINIRLSRYKVRDTQLVEHDLGGRIDIDVEDFPASVMYRQEVIAPDFIVQTPPINPDPELALDEAIAEMEKREGAEKSIALIALSLAKYLKSKKDKLK